MRSPFGRGKPQINSPHKTPLHRTLSKLKQFNPVDRLEGLAKSKVPLFAIHGDIDKVVPLEANSGRVKERYAALGGSMTLVVPPQQGHNMWPGFLYFTRSRVTH